MPQTITAKDGTVLDAGVVNLAKAIRARESKGDYNAVGDAGTSKGAYQWQPGNFEAAATKYGLNPKDFSAMNQDKVAYHQVKALKDKGYSPEQVAAAWNAGEGKIKNDAWKTNVGTTTINGKQIHYDTPGYVQSVMGEFKTLKGGYNPTPYSGGGASPFSLNLSGTEAPQAAAPETPATILPNLGEVGSELSSGLSKRGTDISEGATTMTKGGVHIGTGAIQIAGGIAGGIGDLANAGLQLIPGVQGAEKILGKGVSAVLETKSGQDILKTFSDFAQKNPETAKTIGAGVNVLAAVPILRGLGLVKSAVGDVATAAFRTKVEKSAADEIKEALSSRGSTAVSRATSRGVDPVEFLIKNQDYLPEIVPNPSGGFMYSATKGIEKLAKDLDVDEATLQGLLDEAIAKKNTMVSLESARKQMLKDVGREFPLSTKFKPAIKAVNEAFDSIAESSGGRDMVSLNELNALKRDIRSGVYNIAGDVRGTLSAEVKDVMGRSLRQQVETLAEKLGIKGVPDINKKMAKKIEAQKVLKDLHESRLKAKSGLGKEAAVDIAGAAGETAGNALGIPFAGTLASRGLVGSILRRAPRSAVAKLGRYRSPKSSLKKGVLDIGKGLGLQSVSQGATK